MEKSAQRVVILYQKVARNASHDEKDTLVQVSFIAHTLEKLGYIPVRLPVTLDLEAARKKLVKVKPHLVFNLVESIAGRGEFIYFATQLLDSLRLPYTGAATSALFLTSNKLLAKTIFKTAGIPTPDWWTLADALARAPGLEFPCILKHAWEHASIGIDDNAVIRDARQLALRNHEVGDKYLESFIDGREINVPLVTAQDGVRVLPPSEIRFVDYPGGKPKIVGYEAKWLTDSFEYKNTPVSVEFPEADTALLARLKTIALHCWQTFGLGGYARVDFRVDEQGNPFVLEINANPCLSPDAGFYRSALHAGFTPETLVQTIIQGATKREGKSVWKTQMTPSSPTEK